MATDATISMPSTALAPEIEGLGLTLDDLLREQSDLSAVERFAQFHDEATGPLLQRRYRALLPAEPPGPGQQYAFEVDLDRCSGCKACVTACHALNGLDDHESWRDVGMLVGGPKHLPVLQHVTSSCHHCLDPACLNACPVDAYEKDPVHGIVRHLDDQCFGCKYCALACPYDVPKYHHAKGIVRKCDMCGDRLRAGEAPACVQACPHEAIRIRVVDRDEVHADAEAGRFLPGAPDPSYTQPTTQYRSRSPLAPNLRTADAHALHAEQAHWPLVLMLVLTQWGVGGFLVDALVRTTGAASAGLLTGFALLALLAGLLASLAHLGRPQYAFRAIIGWRHSWLSREVLAFGALVPLAFALVILDEIGWVGMAARTALGGVVAMVGLAAVGCSVLIYHVVRRPFWHAARGGPRFLGTAMVLGWATWLVSMSWVSNARGGSSGVEAQGGAWWSLAVGLPVVVMAKLLIEAEVLIRGRGRAADGSPLHRSALLLTGPRRQATRLRFALGWFGGACLPPMLAALVFEQPTLLLVGSVAMLLTLLAGELTERFLFFAACSKPRMPGGPSA